ncbi:asparagine synthase-related protein [Streptomyces sp. NPDC093085]|uniref:asparagine synthase-related protein n=1 Tax=Streptomyces sp. NPDC093085 TaxID=3155068 RepID=UPI003428CCC1
MIDHASGRPWLMGEWADHEVAFGRAGAARAVLIGRHTADGQEVSRRLAEAGGDPGRVERLAAGVAGSFHLVTSVDGRVRVRGTASGNRRVFRARLAGVAVAADRAGVLASATQADVDDEAVALRMAMPLVNYPLEEQGMWRGVSGVRPDDCLILESDGTDRTARWWTPPEPAASLAEGAPLVGAALAAAVGACTAGGGTVSADLSGGLDSTSLCFLAARGPARLVTYTWQSMDPANDDEVWARRAARALSPSEQVSLGCDEVPAWFDGVCDTAGWATEEPGGWVRDRARLVDGLTRMAARGSRLHLCGGGGDELFTPVPSFLHDLVRSRPGAALGVVRRRRTFRRQPLWPLLRALGDRTPFAAELAASAQCLTRAAPGPGTPQRGWEAALRMPPWATPAAVETVASRLREAAAHAPTALSPYRSLHQVLQYLRYGGNAMRQMDQMTTDRLGIGYATPFHDDAVIEAALSVRLDERMVLTGYKPLLTEAMRGTVPAELLARTTKGEAGVDFYGAIRRHRGELLELFDTPALADAGLIDAGRLRAALRGYPDDTLHTQLLPTLGCEMWLRAQHDRKALPLTVAAGGPR